jgi:hypothetical protein
MMRDQLQPKENEHMPSDEEILLDFLFAPYLNEPYTTKELNK